MLQLSKRYPNKRAFITGAAMGIGKSFCKYLAQENWIIGMVDFNKENLEESAKEIECLGAKVYIYHLDVSNKNDFEKVAENYINQVGGIDLLINNAGVGDGAAFHEYDLENFEWLMSINQMGVVYGCYYFIPKMMEQKSGHIVNIASAAGFANPPRMSAYNMSKASVISLSETLYYEMKEYNVKVSVVMPTFIKTKIMQYARGSGDAITIGQKMVDRSKLSANVAVKEMLKKIGREKFEIALPFQSRMFYWIKRHFPKIFRKLSMSLASKKIKQK